MTRRFKGMDGSSPVKGTPVVGHIYPLIRPRRRLGGWQEPTTPVDMDTHRPRPRKKCVEAARADRAWSWARSEGNRRLRFGDPGQPPPAVAPVERAPEPLGACPDDGELPWHKRQKAKR